MFSAQVPQNHEQIDSHWPAEGTPEDETQRRNRAGSSSAMWGCVWSVPSVCASGTDTLYNHQMSSPLGSLFRLELQVKWREAISDDS